MERKEYKPDILGRRGPSLAETPARQTLRIEYVTDVASRQSHRLHPPNMREMSVAAVGEDGRKGKEKRGREERGE